MQSLRAVAVLLFVSSALAHLCLFSPHQRGTMNGWQQEAADDCALTTGPCGGRPVGIPSVIAEGGSNFTFVFQKNLDHFYSANPGNFTLYWAEHTDFSYIKIGSTPDTDAPSLTFYVIEAELPMKPDRHGVVQVVYYTNNPEAPPAFYQCADMGRF